MTAYLGSFASFFKERATVPVLLSTVARSEIFDEGYLAVKSGFAKLPDILVEIRASTKAMVRVRLLVSPVTAYLRDWKKIDCRHDIDCGCADDVTKLIEAYPFFQGSYYFEWPIHSLSKH